MSFKVLLFPWLAHGHIFPFLELSKKLSKYNFHVHFCSTSINLDSIKKSCNLDEFPIELVELELPSIPELPPQYHTTKNLPPNLMDTLHLAFQSSSSNFSKTVTKLGPNLLIYDVFQPWAARFASSLGIPSVYFNIYGSTPLSFFHHFHTHKSYDTYPIPEIYLHGYEKRALMKQGESVEMGDGDEDDFYSDNLKLSHKIILVKSCRVIDGNHMDYISKLCNKKIVCVGPLITHNIITKENESEILKWLSTKNKCSTLYISFGSETYLSKDQIEEIAKGLELTNVNFIWVLRFPIGSDHGSIEEVLPNGFLERVKDKGIVEVNWAPQAEILSHENVGGFMSHCGWSSVMESIYFGVPIVGIPMQYDQPVISRLVVEVGVGVEVKRDENGKFFGENVAEAMTKIMVNESREGIRGKVRELSKKIKMGEKREFDQVAEQLLSICMKK